MNTTTIYIKMGVAAMWVCLCDLLIPVTQFIIFTMALVLADFVTGISAARRRNEPLTSRGFSRSVLKIGMYCMAILLSHGMDLVFFAPKGLNFDLVWIVAGLIGLSEFKSNLENIAVVTGLDLWAAIADRIPGLPKLPSLARNKAKEADENAPD